jgi:Ca-activated chloride channel family protein
LKENPGYTDLLVSRLAAKQLIEAERGQDNSERAAANDAAWFILLLLPFALLLFRKNLIWVLLLGLLLPHEHELQASESAGFWNHPERLAFEAYQRGDYQTAQALAASRQLRAAAYYRSGQYQQALDLYAEGSSAGSSYNRGNALAQLGRLAEAVIAYQEALLLNPELSLAKYNKRLLELFLQQQSAAEKLSADSSGSENASEDQSPDSTEARIGVAGAETNPGDTPELGPGLGASMQIGQVDPFERFDGREQESERFVLRAQADAEALDQQFIEQWINSLPETSTDLFRRKFLRDYRRQKQLR